MVKQVPEAMIYADHIAWSPWHDDRTAPFLAAGRHGEAWIKVLGRDADSGAESLIYNLGKGWSADSIENTVYENLLVLDGLVTAGGDTFVKNTYAYRPEGHVTHDVSTPTGATVIAYCGGPGELASKIPMPCVDTDAMPWVPRPVGGEDARYFAKMLRGDEENLDTYFLMRAIRGLEEREDTTAHDAPEESFFLEGVTEFYDSVTNGQLLGTKGTYVHRGPWSVHGRVRIHEDQVIFKHDYFVGESDELQAMNLTCYPVETDAVRALKQGRVADLPKRW